MKNKLKLLTLLVLINLSFKAMGEEKYNSELVVSGKEMWERVDYDLSPYPEDVDHYLDNGDVDMKHALWADEESTVHNIGNIYTKRQNYDTQAGGILIGWPNNALKKQDDLIVLRGGGKAGDNFYTTFINDGLVDMGITYHKIDIVLSVLDLVFYKEYSNYKKNVINAEDANIENNGTIQSQGDRLYYRTDVQVGLLQYNNTNYIKNVVLMNNGNLENNGLIQYDRDRNAEVVSIVGVELLNLGLHYNRERTAINSTNANITNKAGGRIFVGGDLLEKRDYNGIDASLIGADFVGKHNKYGIKADGGTIKNYGTIEVERDFSKALDEHNNILDLYLIYGSVLELGLLSFDQMNEKSVGVSVNNGTFYNDGGTISVGANNRKILQILDSSAMAVEANNSKVYFNTEKNEDGSLKTSTINLEGKDVYATYLSGNSEVTFDGTTEINFILPKGIKEEKKAEYIAGINDKILYAENGSHIIKGTGRVVVNGNFNNDNANITIDGQMVSEGTPKEVIWGQIVSTGKITLEDDIKVGTDGLVGLSDEELKKYENHTLISADKGIVGNGNLVSNSYLFTIGSNKLDGKNVQNNLNITDIGRKNFRSIVDNRDLGNIFETSYDGANEAQLAVYRLLAQGENQERFNKVVDEVTGKDTLTTLPAQIYDITRDLNGQFKDFAKNNRADGIVFKYINSKSELDANSSTVGFDRKSSGIMVGYNNNLSEKLRLGAGFSYMTSDIDYTSNSKNKVTTWNARGYSDYNLGFANIFNDLSFAYNQSENKRMADQLSYTGMKESDTDVYTLSLNNSLYKEYKFGDKLTLVPSLNLDFAYIWQDAIKEDGAIGASAKKVEAFYGTLGAGVDGKYNLLTLENSKLNLVGGIDYAYDIIRETDDMSLQVSAFDPYYKENLRELDKKYLDLNIGLNYEYKDSYSVGVKYTKELINDVDNDQFAVDFTYKF